MNSCYRTFGRWLTAIVSLSVAVAATGAFGAEIRIGGSSTVKPIIDAAVKVYHAAHPDVTFVVGGGGSGRGIETVGAGTVDIGMSSRALKDKDYAKCPELKPEKIGIDGIVIVVHAENPLAAISMEQVRDVFAGRITNWKQLGGADAPIQLVSTNEKHGTFEAFLEHFKLEAKPEGEEGSKKRLFFKDQGGAEYSPVSAIAVDGNNPVLAAMQTKQNGLSYASLGAALRVIGHGAPLKILPLDGVTPTEQGVRDGSYKVQRPLLLVTKGAAEPQVEQFIAWCKSAEAQRIVEAMDCIAIAPTK